ncbi:MAG: DUF1569 domain-containing protein [Mariniblastus sp.]|nr:DUF1569 domain-containing protein [Mariniblastus sp.]
MSASKPDLVFESFEQLENYLHQLQRQGYRQTGDWNLAQSVLHLNDWITFPIDGYPRLPLWQRFPLWTYKLTTGRRQLRKILRSGIPPGIPTLASTTYTTGHLDEEEAVDLYLASIDRFRCHNQNYHASPVFGHMTPQEMRQLQLTHAAHHLSLLIPRA